MIPKVIDLELIHNESQKIDNTERMKVKNILTTAIVYLKKYTFSGANITLI